VSRPAAANLRTC